jgi:hypothetical protein
VNPVYEPPTRRILERCLADERRHVADGVAVLDASRGSHAPASGCWPGSESSAPGWRPRAGSRGARRDRRAGKRKRRAGARGAESRRARRRPGSARPRGPRAGGRADAARSPGLVAQAPLPWVRAGRPCPIGAHHVFKTKFVGPTTLVVQARWVAEAGGPWRIREAEVARVEGRPDGAPGPASRPGEV